MTKIIYASGHDIVISTVLFIQHPEVLDMYLSINYMHESAYYTSGSSYLNLTE